MAVEAGCIGGPGIRGILSEIDRAFKFSGNSLRAALVYGSLIDDGINGCDRISLCTTPTRDFTEPGSIMNPIAYNCRYSHHEAMQASGYITTAEPAKSGARLERPNPGQTQILDVVLDNNEG